jgi:hypothetical protein
VRTYQSGPELGALHDIIGPYQPKAQFERVYPILQAQIEAAAATG